MFRALGVILLVTECTLGHVVRRQTQKGSRVLPLKGDSLFTSLDGDEEGLQIFNPGSSLLSVNSDDEEDEEYKAPIVPIFPNLDFDKPVTTTPKPRTKATTTVRPEPSVDTLPIPASKIGERTSNQGKAKGKNYIYLHGPPPGFEDDDEDEDEEEPTNYRIIVVRVPPLARKPRVNPTKTIVYVLTKKAERQPVLEEPKPEVLFIKYDQNKEKTGLPFNLE